MKPKQLDISGLEKALGTTLVANGKYTQVLHDAVVALQANRRAGTHATKTTGTVNYSDAKPWRQKGTGRARSGFRGSAIWRGGAVAFGPQPRDYSKKVSKTSKKIALKKALSEASKQNSIFTLDTLEIKEPKTKLLHKLIKDAGFNSTLLIITQKADDNLILASRNIPTLEIISAAEVNAEDILRSQQILILTDALPVLGQRITPKK